MPPERGVARAAMPLEQGKTRHDANGSDEITPAEDVVPAMKPGRHSYPFCTREKTIINMPHSVNGSPGTKEKKGATIRSKLLPLWTSAGAKLKLLCNYVRAKVPPWKRRDGLPVTMEREQIKDVLKPYQSIMRLAFFAAITFLTGMMFHRPSNPINDSENITMGITAEMIVGFLVVSFLQHAVVVYHFVHSRAARVSPLFSWVAPFCLWGLATGWMVVFCGHTIVAVYKAYMWAIVGIFSGINFLVTLSLICLCQIPDEHQSVSEGSTTLACADVLERRH